MATTSAAVRQLSDQNSQGTQLGAATSDPIGFYGVTTLPQPITGGSLTSGALASSLAFQLAKLGLITVSSYSA